MMLNLQMIEKSFGNDSKRRKKGERNVRCSLSLISVYFSRVNLKRVKIRCRIILGKDDSDEETDGGSNSSTSSNSLRSYDGSPSQYAFVKFFINFSSKND